MTNTIFPQCTAFIGHRLVASGPLDRVAVAVKGAVRDGEPVQIYSDRTGKVIDIDPRGSDAEVIARLPRESFRAEERPSDAPRGRGRPKLGVVAREVTLLPRHWEWLNGQPGGASVTLRKLVEEARRKTAGSDGRRVARDAAYAFLSAIGGNLPGFEEATRALFANNAARFRTLLATWPADIRNYALKLADI